MVVVVVPLVVLFPENYFFSSLHANVVQVSAVREVKISVEKQEASC